MRRLLSTSKSRRRKIKMRGKKMRRLLLPKKRSKKKSHRKLTNMKRIPKRRYLKM